MKTYVIVDVRITDPARYEDYKKLTPASLLPFDGRFLVRGGQTELLKEHGSPGGPRDSRIPDGTRPLRPQPERFFYSPGAI